MESTSFILLSMLFFVIVAVFLLAAVLVGGILVYKTKGFTDPLFQVGKPKAEVFNIDDGLGLDEAAAAELPEAVQRQNERFINDFAKELGRGKG